MEEEYCTQNIFFYPQLCLKHYCAGKYLVNYRSIRQIDLMRLCIFENFVWG